MMRQAGRYQKAYRDLAKRHPDFRERWVGVWVWWGRA